MGVAGALRAIAGQLGDAEVVRALDFLLSHGLADSHDKVRRGGGGGGADGWGGRVRVSEQRGTEVSH